MTGLGYLREEDMATLCLAFGLCFFLQGGWSLYRGSGRYWVLSSGLGKGCVGWAAVRPTLRRLPASIYEHGITFTFYLETAENFWRHSIFEAAPSTLLSAGFPPPAHFILLPD